MLWLMLFTMQTIKNIFLINETFVLVCGCNETGSLAKGCDDEGTCECDWGFYGKKCEKGKSKLGLAIENS